MVIYPAELTPVAKKDLEHLNKSDAQRIVKRLRWLVENYGEINHKALKAPLRGKFGFRVGAHRVIYARINKKVIFYSIKHRKKVYKEKNN